LAKPILLDIEVIGLCIFEKYLNQELSHIAGRETSDGG
jgi:hypothetical protein